MHLLVREKSGYLRWCTIDCSLVRDYFGRNVCQFIGLLLRSLDLCLNFLFRYFLLDNQYCQNKTRKKYKCLTVRILRQFSILQFLENFMEKSKLCVFCLSLVYIYVLSNYMCIHYTSCCTLSDQSNVRILYHLFSDGLFIMRCISNAGLPGSTSVQ